MDMDRKRKRPSGDAGINTRPAKAKKSSDVPAFLQKTIAIMASPDFEPYVRWGKKGKTILVTDVVGFQSHVLPKFFKHGNFPSFARQLNM